ncbi:ATP-binding protein [Roseateles flavus]|uniref:ATP-binding protein n=1 Tax=Roseateles flavus TaxID=3149041 RepID=A0ABV0GBE8_9BURK
MPKDFGRLWKNSEKAVASTKTCSLIEDMQSEEIPYAHGPVDGLPKSLVQLEDQTVAAIALMTRQAGLNRKVRRHKKPSSRPGAEQAQKLAKRIFKKDWVVLATYVGPFHRWGSFWSCAMEKQRSGSLVCSHYSDAIDVQLLNGYDAAWPDLKEDAEALSQDCPEWPRIREKLLTFWKYSKVDMPLGVFMLWPRLLADLRRWEALDDQRRVQVGHAVFSLSSIGWTRWFIDQALSVCPALTDEFEGLDTLSRKKVVSAFNEQSSEEAVTSEMPIQESEADSASVVTSVCDWWSDLGAEIAAIHHGWADEPARELLVRAVALGERAAQLLPLMPEKVASPQEDLEAGLDALRDRLLTATQQEGLHWFGTEELEGVLARWLLAAKDAANDVEVGALAADAEQALSRFASAAIELQVAQAQVAETKSAIARLDAEQSANVSLALRIGLAKRRDSAVEASSQAARRETEAMLAVLAAASPRGAAFDPGVNYTVKLAEREFGLAEIDDGEVSRADEGRPIGEAGLVAPLPPTAVVDGRPVPPKPVLGAEANELAVESTPESIELGKSKDVELAAQAVSAVHGPAADFASASLPSVATDGPELQQASVDASAQLSSSKDAGDFGKPEVMDADTVEGDFTDEVGDRCRPIWTLLRMGKPALAFQYASALHDQSPNLRVPPPELLRSVALSTGLAASDGPLAVAIGEAFLDIDASWFEPGDAPAKWHTALNLLLIAATLRPMVLAPATGASAIAHYRHLDGRHVALLDLVRKVGDLSEPLTGFSIGRTVLGSAADEASQREHIAQLSKDTSDWLYERAPSKKFRYAPASKVWLHWLKPGECIHRLISPVARNAVEERGAVRAAIEELSDYDAFFDRLRDTDRRQLQRRGQDIEAGALEHLWVATCEAVSMAKGWLAAATLFSESGGRLRGLIGQLKAAFDVHAEQVCSELDAEWEGDGWGQVAAASKVLAGEIRAIANMLKQSDAVLVAEPQPMELLACDLLMVPGTTIAPSWAVESEGDVLLRALESWSTSPVPASAALQARIEGGDLGGAERLLQLMPEDAASDVVSIERAKELWARDLQKEIQRARRASEVGLAYGYLSDEDRSACESELSSVELAQRDTMRFDVATKRVRAVEARIEQEKSRRVEEARQAFNKERPALSPEYAREVEAPLKRSDIHTFNELLQRVRQGSAPWPERTQRLDLFSEFYPVQLTELLANLGRLERTEVDKLIRNGGSIGAVSFELDGDEQARIEAEEVYKVWATGFGRHKLDRESLRKVLEALGVSVRSLEQDKAGQGWTLFTETIDDREVCPVPHFGSRAQGRYRVVVLGDRASPEDLLQRIGDSTQQTATIVLSLTRSPPRFWPDLAKLSKERQRSFLLLDEAILLSLLAQRGSRLASWFALALPFTYSEPYDASAGFVPPEMFYGRTSELDAVKEQGGCYFIYGGRQLGKTALLRRAEKTFHEPAEERYAIWVDLLAQGIGERRPAVDVWLSLADKLRELKIHGLDIPPVNTAKPASIDAFLSSIRAFIQAKPGRRILLLLDEADHFFEQDARYGSSYAETRRLKQLMDETERRFKVVFAGLHNVLRTASTSNQPLGHLNEAVRIGPLMNEREIRAAEELITRPIEAAGFEFDDRSLVMRILAQTNYYPSLIQLYCTQLLRHLRESKLRRRDFVGPRFRIDEADIESVFAGRPLRDAIRSKFRLTLQLDDRYEVIAYAIGLEALAPGFDHAEGVDWPTLWRDCATSWWPEGFKTTSERDFLALLEEMVQLGVLSPAKGSDRYSLRNPNVLLLLGSRQEIENTLGTEREPRIEFESTIFRPALGRRVDDPARSPLTYRQLDEVVQMRNSVLLVAGSEAAGLNNLLAGLREQPGMSDTGRFVQIDRSTTRAAFTQELDKEVQRRVGEGVTVMLVPATVPWDAEWVLAARAKLKALRSTTSFVSVVFAADPMQLWTLAAPVPDQAQWVEPWLSILPWSRGFVRKWLEELQLPVEEADRLYELTGNWGGLLEAAVRMKAGAAHSLDFVQNMHRMAAELDDPKTQQQYRMALTGGVLEGERVLRTMLELGEGVTEGDLVEYGELAADTVTRALLWAEPLGLVTRNPGSVWVVDPFVRRVFSGGAQ